MSSNRLIRGKAARPAPEDIVRSGLCIGCGACVSRAARADVGMAFDPYGEIKPAGAKGWSRGESMDFSAICPFSPTAEDEDELAARHFPLAPDAHHLLGRFEAAYVGYAQEADYRAQGSSGGLVTWIATELLRRGLVDGVAHVVPGTQGGGDDRLFRYTISRSIDDLRAGSKSRYYPVEMSGVLDEIRQRPGRYAVVGIPCFIKAVRLSCLEDAVLRERVAFTLGIFCGHMKSARMAESFAWQMDTDIRDAKGFDYRVKNPDRPANWYRAEITFDDGATRGLDWWHMADGDWGAGFFQNSACNFCDDVVAETADIAFGDAWKEPYSSDGRGTNVVIVRSPVLLDLVRAAMQAGRLALSPVDADFVISTQAAGFRQRRQGLAYRLTWLRLGIRPRKRVQPDNRQLGARRKLIYHMRYAISFWSHRVFRAARLLRWPGLYIFWARNALAWYQGLAYSRGRIGRIVDRLGLTGGE